MKRLRTSIVLLAGAAALIASACRPAQQMADQPKYDPLASSALFDNGSSARPLVAGTVPRGQAVVDDFFHTGKNGAVLGDGYPFEVTEDVVRRGHERFDIYCSECHGRRGLGDGMIVRRGYRRPPSYHIDRLRTAPTGHFFDVMTNGFGAMPQYGTMIPPQDRWAIIAYIRALQLSQNATINDVPADQRAALSGGITR
jgi:hypothetical protein